MTGGKWKDEFATLKGATLLKALREEMGDREYEAVMTEIAEDLLSSDVISEECQQYLVDEG